MAGYRVECERAAFLDGSFFFSGIGSRGGNFFDMFGGLDRCWIVIKLVGRWDLVELGIGDDCEECVEGSLFVVGSGGWKVGLAFCLDCD